MVWQEESQLVWWRHWPGPKTDGRSYVAHTMWPDWRIDVYLIQSPTTTKYDLYNVQWSEQNICVQDSAERLVNRCLSCIISKYLIPKNKGFLRYVFALFYVSVNEGCVLSNIFNPTTLIMCLSKLRTWSPVDVFLCCHVTPPSQVRRGLSTLKHVKPPYFVCLSNASNL